MAGTEASCDRAPFQAPCRKGSREQGHRTSRVGVGRVNTVFCWFPRICQSKVQGQDFAVRLWLYRVTSYLRYGTEQSIVT